jgi:hypothetical protein
VLGGESRQRRVERQVVHGTDLVVGSQLREFVEPLRRQLFREFQVCGGQLLARYDEALQGATHVDELAEVRVGAALAPVDAVLLRSSH